MHGETLKFIAVLIFPVRYVQRLLHPR